MYAQKHSITNRQVALSALKHKDTFFPMCDQSLFSLRISLCGNLVVVFPTVGGTVAVDEDAEENIAATLTAPLCDVVCMCCMTFFKCCINRSIGLFLSASLLSALSCGSSRSINSHSFFLSLVIYFASSTSSSVCRISSTSSSYCCWLAFTASSYSDWFTCAQFLYVS